jgi:hypothetical protein
MNKFLLIAALFAFSAANAQAAELRCASGSNENVYFSSGQILITAKFADESSLESLRMDGPGSMGFLNEDAEPGVKSRNGKYARFKGADAWCNYTVTLPVGFSARKTTPMFLDAKCEGGIVSDHRLHCRID